MNAAANTNDIVTNDIVTVDPYTIEDIGNSFMTSINVRVKGYWSRNAITIYARIDNDHEAVRASPTGFGYIPKLALEISHSSGGRDNVEVVDEIEAAGNFAEAIMVACSHARKIRAAAPEILAIHAEAMAIREEERAMEKAALTAKAEADIEVGVERAEEIMNTVTDLATGEQEKMPNYRSSEIEILAYARGNETRTKIVCRASSSRVTWMVNTLRVSRAIAMQHVINSSAARLEIFNPNL